MAKAPEIDHLERAISAARKALDHQPLISSEPEDTAEETALQTESQQ